MRTIKILNALMTFSVLAGIISLTFVEKQPLVLAFTGMCLVLYLTAWNARAEQLQTLRSNADEDRPE